MKILNFLPGRLFAIGLLLLLTSSCYNYKRQIYIRDDVNMFSDRPLLIATKPDVYRINVNDILSIQVQSTDPEVTQMFNTNQNDSFDRAEPGNLYLSGYVVNDLGLVKLPIIGEIYVKDLTINEIQNSIQTEVDKYIISAAVIVKLVSFKITVLGEVRSPGYYYIFNGQANIFESLGLAGDVTEFGKREGVKLLRQTQDGTEVVLVDLTNPDLLYSDYYYVQPNDVIYVEPFKANTKRSNLETLTYISLFFTLISTTLLLLNYVNTN